MAATDFVTESAIDSLTTTIANAVKANTTATGTAQGDATQALADAAAAQGDATQALSDASDAQTTADNHISDSTAAHAASAISFADAAGDYTATDVEAALAEVRVVADAAAGGGVAINDSLTNSTDAWSSQKIADEIAQAVSDLIGGAPGALDTLNELAAAINDDAAFTTTVTTALGLRVRVDAAQAFTGPQQLQGRSNLGIAASSVDFAANFTTAIA